VGSVAQPACPAAKAFPAGTVELSAGASRPRACGSPRVAAAAEPGSSSTLRTALVSRRPWCARIQPTDLKGLAHHALGQSAAGDDLFGMLGPHQTTVLDVVLPRKIHQGVFRLTRSLMPQDFSRPVAGEVIGQAAPGGIRSSPASWPQSQPALTPAAAASAP